MGTTSTHQPMLNSTWASKNPTTGEVAAFQPWILARISPSRLLFRTIFTSPGYLLWTYWSRLNFSSTAGQKEAKPQKHLEWERPYNAMFYSDLFWFIYTKGKESLNILQPLVSLMDTNPVLELRQDQFQGFQPREIPHTPETCPALIWPDGFEYSVEEVVCLCILEKLLLWFSDDLH